MAKIVAGRWSLVARKAGITLAFACVAVMLVSSCNRGDGGDDFRGRFKSATAKEDRGGYWQAVGEYKSLLRGEPEANDRINVLFRLGDCYRKTGNYVFAEEAYQVVAADYSEEIYLELAYGRMVDCYREAGRYRDALGMYPRLISVTAEDILLASIYFDLGKVYLKLRDGRSARGSFRRAIKCCRAVQRQHAGGDFASYAVQIEDEVRQAMGKLD